MKGMYKIWWYAMVILFLISSISVLFLGIPVNIPDEGLPVTYTICGVLFWLGLIIGLLLWLILYLRIRRTPGFDIVKKHMHRPGMFNFFSDTIAKAWDCVMIISLLAVIAGTIFLPYENVLNSIFICIFLFSFHMHYLYNGKVYAYITKIRRKGKHEKN